MRQPMWQVHRMDGRQRSRSFWSSVGTGLMALVISTSSANAETQSYVVSWFVPAMYAHKGDCKALEPMAEGGFGAVESMYRRMLRQLGYDPDAVGLKEFLGNED